MCRSRYVYWVAGLLVGVSLLLAGGYYGAGSLMVVETESPQSEDNADHDALRC